MAGDSSRRGQRDRGIEPSARTKSDEPGAATLADGIYLAVADAEQSPAASNDASFDLVVMVDP